MEDDFTNLGDAFEGVFKSPSDLKPFRLLDLPTELWLHICELAVKSPNAIEVSASGKEKDRAAIVSQPAITRTCWLIRNEILPLFYQSNVFTINDYILNVLHEPSYIQEWFVAIGRRNLRAMHKVVVPGRFLDRRDVQHWERLLSEIGIKTTVHNSGWMITVRFL